MSADGPVEVARPAHRSVEVVRRIGLVRELLARRGAGAALLSTRRNVAWLTVGAEAHVEQATGDAIASLLVTPGGIVCLAQNIETARLAEEELAGLGIETIGVPWWEPDAVAREAARRAGTPPLTDADLEADLVPVRSVLSPVERERLAVLGGIARRAVEATLANLRVGTTEEEIAAELVGRLVGVRPPVLLVAADDRIARYRHPIPKPIPVRGRAMLVLVAERWGLHVALTRFAELEPPSPSLARRAAAVAEVDQAIREATRPGATLGTVFAAAQAAYADAGFPGEWRDHHQGGTIGYRGRESVATPDDPTPIVPGMAFAWNPSIAGVKAEETFVLEDDGERRIVTA